jgi:hypothetical protein
MQIIGALIAEQYPFHELTAAGYSLVESLLDDSSGLLNVKGLPLRTANLARLVRITGNIINKATIKKFIRMGGDINETDAGDTDAGDTLFMLLSKLIVISRKFVFLPMLHALSDISAVVSHASAPTAVAMLVSAESGMNVADRLLVRSTAVRAVTRNMDIETPIIQFESYSFLNYLLLTPGVEETRDEVLQALVAANRVTDSVRFVLCSCVYR